MFDDDEDIDRVDPRKLPIYKKGIEILEVVQTICDLIPENDKMLQSIRHEMMGV